MRVCWVNSGKEHDVLFKGTQGTQCHYVHEPVDFLDIWKWSFWFESAVPDDDAEMISYLVVLTKIINMYVVSSEPSTICI